MPGETAASPFLEDEIRDVLGSSGKYQIFDNFNVSSMEKNKKTAQIWIFWYMAPLKGNDINIRNLY